MEERRGEGECRGQSHPRCPSAFRIVLPKCGEVYFGVPAWQQGVLGVGNILRLTIRASGSRWNHQRLLSHHSTLIRKAVTNLIHAPTPTSPAE